ncbi:MAG: TIR domain-containing protein [Candidatus Methanofastidiosia archaeon]|jgi:hypothetical protein
MNNERKQKLFLSHSGKDKAFVKKLAGRLLHDGFLVWYDDWEIHVGDSIIEKMNYGISSSDFLVVILSRNSVKSKWVEKELNAAVIKEIDSKGIFILPILLDKCKIPPLLSDRKYADFSQNSDFAYQQLIEAINYHSKRFGTSMSSLKIEKTLKIPPLKLLNILVNPKKEQKEKISQIKKENFNFPGFFMTLAGLFNTYLLLELVFLRQKLFNRRVCLATVLIGVYINFILSILFIICAWRLLKKERWAVFGGIICCFLDLIFQVEYSIPVFDLTRASALTKCTLDFVIVAIIGIGWTNIEAFFKHYLKRMNNLVFHIMRVSSIPRSAEKPRGITLLTIFVFIYAILGFIFGAVFIYFGSQFHDAVSIVVGIVALVLIAVYIITGIGLFQGKKWARNIYLVLNVFYTLIIIIFSYFNWGLSILIIVPLASIWYLTRPHAKKFFEMASLEENC